MTQELLGLNDVDAGQAGWDANVDTNQDLVQQYIKTLKLSIAVQGGIGSPSDIEMQLQTAESPAVNVAEAFFLRVRVTDLAGYLDATNATIAVFGGTTLEETISAGKDLVVKSDGAGLVEIRMTNATVETVTLRPGHPPVQGHFLNVNNSQDVAHA